MSINMYQVAIPTFIRGLENLSAILTKAQESGISEETLTTAKLAEDMFPLTRQIQIASDAAKGAAARLSGAEVPSFEDTETTIADLQSRIEKTVSFLKTVKEDSMTGSETKQVEFANKGGSYSFNGQTFLLHFAFPNFFFHITTAYDILRNQGVVLGKKDFLGQY